MATLIIFGNIIHLRIFVSNSKRMEVLFFFRLMWTKLMKLI